ncbi:MAG: type II secretion system protein [bacterium]|nr:type II secretion system protein [bacterium]
MNTTGTDSRHRQTAGFTLLELVVSIAIFTILTTVVLINYPLFGDQLGVDLRSQDIALLARQAQVFALGVRGSTFSQAPDFERGVFGLYITDQENTAIRFFADRDSRGSAGYRLYNDTPDCGLEGSECVEKFALTRGYYISDVCVKPGSSSKICNVSELDISYARPLPEARINTNGLEQPVYSYADIVIRSPRTGVAKKVVIYSSGQITVQNYEEEQ